MPRRHSKTAVIFAPNSNNLGMYSVDLAGYNLLKTITSDVDFFAESEPYRAGYKYGSIVIRGYKSAKHLWGYDRIVYWGDFTTSFAYAKGDYFRRTGIKFFPYSKKLIKSGLTAKSVQRRVIARWEKLYLPEFEDKRYYSIGQNFQTMTKSEFEALPITARNKYQRFRAILPRDSTSLHNLNLLFNNCSTRPLLQQICDLAFLIDRPPMVNSSRGLKRKNVGVYFRRSKIQNIGKLLDVISQDANVVPFSDWLDNKQDFNLAFEKNCALMRECDVVVSDTYHFLINALREGCPVIGLGNAESEQVTTIGDYKKKVLFADTGLSEYYLEMTSGLLDEKHVEQIREHIRNISVDYWRPYRVDREIAIQQIKSALSV